MRTEFSNANFSFCQWYPLLKKNALEAETIVLSEEVCKYLEHDAFLLPLEATTNGLSSNSEWSDGSAVNNEPEEESEEQPSFPDFSGQIQEVIDNFGAVFIKLNWSTPTDATWVSPTKTLKCTSLEEVYLLLKSSDRISHDLNSVKNSDNKESPLRPCLVLKKWREIDPCTEFRCFVVNKELVGICQRDCSQYYKHIENEKYDIQQDIKSLFLEKIKGKFAPDNYSFDVIRYKKDKVKIVDFGPLNESVIKGTLFTYDELHSETTTAPEFRFIAEDMGIQPKPVTHFCVPQEINEFFQTNSGGRSMMDVLRQEVEEQNRAENADSGDEAES